MMLYVGITNGSDNAGLAGGVGTFTEKAPVVVVFVDTSPAGNEAGGVAPTIGTGPMITVAPDNGLPAESKA